MSFNKELCERLHADNDKEHTDMWHRMDKTEKRVDKIQLLLISNLAGVVAALLILIITNWPA